jgi:hypothetical protein
VQGEDQLEVLLREDGTVLFRCEGLQGRLPDPPFCVTPGCISGPRQRGQLEALRDALGWSELETDEDKQWVQILLH